MLANRAAERYADITDEDRERQRLRGWGTHVGLRVFYDKYLTGHS